MKPTSQGLAPERPRAGACPLSPTRYVLPASLALLLCCFVPPALPQEGWGWTGPVPEHALPLRSDGPPFFAVGLEVQSLGEATKRADELRAAGFNAVWASGAFGGAAVGATWDLAASGFAVMLGGTVPACETDEAATREQIQKYFDCTSWTTHLPGYLGWMMGPLAWQGVKPPEVYPRLLAAKAGNPLGLVCLGVAGDQPLNDLEGPIPTDAVALVPYPDGFAGSLDPPVGKKVRELVPHIRDTTTLLVLLPGRETQAGALTADALRFMAFDAIVAGARGLFFQAPANAAIAQAQKQVAGELGSLLGVLSLAASYTPSGHPQPPASTPPPATPGVAIPALAPPYTGPVCGAAFGDPSGAKPGTGPFLIVANESAKEIKQTLNLGRGTAVYALPDYRAIPANPDLNGRFEDTLPGHGARVYVTDKAALGLAKPLPALVWSPAALDKMRKDTLAWESSSPLLWRLQRFGEVTTSGLEPYVTPDGSTGYNVTGRALLNLAIPNRSAWVDAKRLTRFSMRMFSTVEGQGALLALSTAGEVSFVRVPIISGWHLYDMDLTKATWESQQPEGQKWGGTPGVVQALTFTPTPQPGSQIAFDWIRLEPDSTGEVKWELDKAAEVGKIEGLAASAVDGGVLKGRATGETVSLELALPGGRLDVKRLPFLSFPATVPAPRSAQVECWWSQAGAEKRGGIATFRLQPGLPVQCVDLSRLGFAGATLAGEETWGGPEAAVTRLRLVLPAEKDKDWSLDWLRLGPNYDLRAVPAEPPALP